MTITEFQQDILTGLPDSLPQPKPLDDKLSHAPYRKQILSAEEKKLALKNALRYFDPKHHQELLPEFKKELEKEYGSININLEDGSFEPIEKEEDKK